MSIVDSPTSPSARKSLGNNTGTRPSPATVHALNRGLRGASLSSGHLPGSAAGQSPGGNGGSGSTVSSPKTFQCTGYPGCNMVFTRSEHLARHERKHTGEKPYKCIVANCPRTFSRYDNMIQHTQTHGDRSKRDSLASGPAAAAVSSASQSRSSSVQSTPLITRPRGGSSPMIFHEDSNRSGYSSSQQSPAVGSYGASPAMNYHHHQQQHNLPHGSHHPIQWSHPSGAPATASPGPPGSGYAHGYPLPPGSSPMTRTLKANSRSLPHLQPRSSTGGSLGPGGDSPSGGLQQGMSSMEIEELKRRKSEILLPSYSRAAGSSSSGLSAVGSAGYAPGAVARFGRGGSGGSFSSSTQGPAGGGSAIGLGMSPFTQTTSHPQSLPKVEQLTPQEQERLNEHRRSAQAALFKNNPTGSMDPRAVSSIRDLNASPYRNVSVPGLPQHHLLDQDKERFLDHRKSILGPINNHMDPRFQKRSSNDPTDMVVQPLPSRDARSGMQWFSQVNAAGTPAQPPATASPRSSMTLRDQPPTGLSSFAPGEQPFGHPTRAMISSSSASSRHSSMDEGPMVLPPILGNYEQQEQQQHTSLATHTQPRPRTQSSHVHPLSRPSSSQFDPPTPTTKGTEIIATAPTGERRFKYEPILAPGLERQLEDRFYPIRKREVVEEIERMDAEQYVHLWSRVSNAFATEQFRNPEALCNLTAILCVVRINTEAYGSVKQEDDANHGSRDMEIDDEGSKATESSSMDVDSNVAAGASVAKPCRAILNIDADNYRRDPEQELKDIEELTLTSRVPVHSFVAAFEIPPTTPASSSPNAHWQAPTSESGCPETAGLARLYLPENSFRPKESLQLSPALIDPAGPWQVCEFQEFPGLAVWVQQETLSRYRTLATKGSKARPPYRMALTLLERGPSRRESGSSVGSGNRDDSYISENGNDDGDADDDVRLKESVLYPNMIERVWKDMFHQYQEHQHQLRLQQQQQQQQHHHSQHYQQQQYQPYPPPPLPHNQHHPQQHPQQQQSALPPPLQKRVATYEEYHNSLQQQHVTAEASRRESGYHPQQQQQQQALYFHPPPPSQQQQQQTSPTGAYHDYRGHRQSGFMHREDLSSAPSSPRSPSIRDDLQEESLSSTSSIGSAVTAAQAQATANMHRRISIAELCNPMQGLATERDRLREGGSSGNEPPSNLPKRSSM
ncbi:hypothetical protein BGZ83_004410 [Gryganskiella cystojenkinii]|nr:hypothetical protein BGZ83_004410 [Gryganskiella cystojenkinii]